MTRLAVLAAAAALAGCAATPQATVERANPEAMILEVSAITGLPYDGEPLPLIAIGSREALAFVAGDRNSRSKIGLYVTVFEEILIADDLSARVECSTLAHELAHHLQYKANAPLSEEQAGTVHEYWERKYPAGCRVEGPR